VKLLSNSKWTNSCRIKNASFSTSKAYISFFF